MALLGTLNNIRLVNYFPALTDEGSPIPIYRVTTDDDQAAVEGAGYFNAIVAQAPVGTVIQVLTEADATPVLLTYVVTANNGTAVTVALQDFAGA